MTTTEEKPIGMAGETNEEEVAGTTADPVEAPVTFKAYLICAFAAFGGIFFGYDSGYINGVLGMDYFIKTFENLVSTLVDVGAVHLTSLVGRILRLRSTKTLSSKHGRNL